MRHANKNMQIRNQVSWDPCDFMRSMRFLPSGNACEPARMWEFGNLSMLVWLVEYGAASELQRVSEITVRFYKVFAFGQHGIQCNLAGWIALGDGRGELKLGFIFALLSNTTASKACRSSRPCSERPDRRLLLFVPWGHAYDIVIRS